MTDQIIDVALIVARALEACRIPYTIGGSLASSFSGEPRFTQDVDILVGLEDHHVDPLVAVLGPAFYADTDAMHRAIARRRSVNLIHVATSIKVDLFVAGGSPLDHHQLRRSERRQIAAGPDSFANFHSHEDILLQKLFWFRAGGEVSDRQWRDVQSIALKQGRRLDVSYLRQTAPEAGLLDLLERLLG